MTVIAMTREMGSLGKDVAAEIAKQMSLEVIHHELVEHDIADRLQLRPSEVHNYLEGSPSLLERWKIDRNKLSRYTAEEILQLANRGRVLIRGWGAVFLLRPISHVLCVRVCAPMDFRVKVIKERLGISDKLAYLEIKKNDAAHTRTIKNFAEGDWENAINYDIVLNTERAPIEECAARIAEHAKCEVFQETAASRETLSNTIIEAKVRAALNSMHKGIYPPNIQIKSVNDGKVVLAGTSSSNDIIKEAISVASQIEDVNEVQSEIVKTITMARH